MYSHKTLLFYILFMLFTAGVIAGNENTDDSSANRGIGQNNTEVTGDNAIVSEITDPTQVSFQKSHQNVTFYLPMSNTKIIGIGFQLVLILVLIYMVYISKRSYLFLIPTALLSINSLLLFFGGESVYRALYFSYEAFNYVLVKEGSVTEYFSLRHDFAFLSGYLAIALGIALVTFTNIRIWIWFVATYSVVLLSALIFMGNYPGITLSNAGGTTVDHYSSAWFIQNIFVVSMFLALPKALEQAWKKVPKNDSNKIFLKPVLWFLSKNSFVGSFIVLSFLLWGYFGASYENHLDSNRNHLGISGLVLILSLSWDKLIFLTPLRKKADQMIDEIQI